MRSFKFAVLSLVFFAAPQLLPAQNKPVQCDVTCEPDPTSGSYGPTYGSRYSSANARGYGGGNGSPTAAGHVTPSPLAVHAPGGAPSSPVIPGSQSYSYAIPIVNLPGRNGLDVNLTLFYNSQLWTFTGSSVTYNADRDFPSYGFRLGYGLIEAPASGSTSYILTEADGTKRELRLSSGSTYITVDASYMVWSSSTHILQRKDGTQWFYTQVPSNTSFYRPTKIEDTNGNYITIAYSTASGADKQAISTITDTIGRLITFAYNGTHELTGITVTPPGGTAKTVAYFNWAQIGLTYNFSTAITVTDTQTSGTLVNVLTSCAYPNAAGTGPGMGYGFSYGGWGLVDQISKLSATGVTRSYVSYDYPSTFNALISPPTFQHQKVNNGSTTATWTYSSANGMAITDPTGKITTTALMSSSWQAGLLSSVTVANATTTYRTVSYSWTQDNTSLSVPLNPRPLSVSTTLNDSGQVSTVSYGYDGNGNVSDFKEYDFGGLARETKTTYLTYATQHILDRPSQVLIYNGSSQLKARTDIAYDSYSGGLTSVTTTNHDSNYGTTFTARGNVTSATRYTNAAAGSGATTRTLTYDTTGNVLSAQVDCCQLEQWNYNSTTVYAYPSSVTRGATGTQLTTSASYDLGTGLVTNTTDPNGQVTYFNYDALERISSVTGPLNTSQTVSYDDNSTAPAVTQTTAVDTGKSAVQISTMDGLGRVTKTQTQDGAGGNCSAVATQYNGAGQVTQVSNPYSCSGSPVYTQYHYDTLGRVAMVIPTDGSSSSNNTQYLYSGNSTTVTDPAGKQRQYYSDALGRLIQVSEPGWGNATPGTGSVTIAGSEQKQCNEPLPPPPAQCTDYSYDSGTVSITVNGHQDSVPFSGNPISSSTANSIASALATQINGDSGSSVTATASGAKVTLVSKQSGSITNYPLTTSYTSPLGLWSFSSSASGPTLTGGTDAATQGNPSLQHPMPTVYTYDPMNDLTLAVQGSQTRTFVYDSMSHLTSSTTPEAGAVSFTYTSYGQVSTRTDARNVQTSYQYDGLNRPIGVSYTIPNGSGVSAMPNVCTPAGGTAANVCISYGTSAAAYNNGRPLQMTDPTGSESYTYDALGRVSGVTKTINGISYPLGYTYDFAGDLTSLTYPSGRVVQQGTDTLGRLQQITSSGTNYVSNLAYNAAWQPTGFNYGNGVQASFAYNSRMELQSLDYTLNSQPLFGLNYYYKLDSTNCPSGSTGNNGQIQCINDAVDSGRSATYTYDAWNRLWTATTSGSTNYPAWGLLWNYDRYGNRQSQTVTAGTAPSNALTPSATTNRLAAPYGYDASGNMTYDGLNTLTYDGESRVTANLQNGATSTYAYDGNGLRIEKQTGGISTTYIFSGPRALAEYTTGSPASSPGVEYLYSTNGLAAVLSNGSSTYIHSDHLSARLLTNDGGSMVGQQGHYPFGESWYAQDTTTKWEFTSYERDPESANDYAISRYNVSRLGRFTSPDRLGGSISNPQSLNRFSYVMNDPLNAIDPIGLDCVYLTDNGLGIESIDQASDASSCGSDGGYWVDGLVTDVYICPDGTCISLQGTNSLDGTQLTGAFYNLGQDSGGFGSGQPPPGCGFLYQGASLEGTLCGSQFAPFQPPATDSQRLQAVAAGARVAGGFIPTICGPVGVFGYAGGSKLNGIVEYDSHSGLSAGVLGEYRGVGAVGTATQQGLAGEPIVFVGEGVGGFTTISTTPQVGPFVGADIPGTSLGAGIGVYGTITSVSGCNE